MYGRFAQTVLLTQGILLFAGSAHGQTMLDLPRRSQQAQVMQRIGLTEITIHYSRPLVGGRKIFGGLQPYGQVWRAGADENTTIAFSDPVRIEGKTLPKGTYGLHMIPGESVWTVIFSKNSTSWGSFTYDAAEDALRVTVKPQPSELHEALTYDFEDLKPDSSVVALRWEKLVIPFKVGVDTNEVVQQSVRNQLRGWVKFAWEGWDEAASYLLDHKLNLSEALTYADASIHVEERFDNLMTKAGILEGLNRGNEAAPLRKKAIAMGNTLQLHSYGRQLQIQGKQDKAFEIFRINIKKDPNHWIVHSEVARIALAQGRFDNAVKEMKLAAAGAPAAFKPTMENFVKRLEAKEDINK